MIKVLSAYAYCNGPIEEIENYYEAVNDTENSWVVHHRLEIIEFDDGTFISRSDEYLIEKGWYYHRPAEELIFMKKSDHTVYHNTHMSFLTKKRRSESRKQLWENENFRNKCVSGMKKHLETVPKEILRERAIKANKGSQLAKMRKK